MSLRTSAFWGLALALHAGCAPRPVGFDSPDPVGRIDAIARANRTHDRSAIPQLIRLLDADDPVIRLAAIRTLESITGQTLGYRHTDPQWRREEATARWVRWHMDGGDQLASGKDSDRTPSAAPNTP
jgi:hypothetical protein